MNENETTPVNDGRTVLARLFRQTMAGLNVDQERLAELIQTFVNDPANGVPEGPIAHRIAADNITKALNSPVMTLNTFLRGLKVLAFHQAHLAVAVTLYKGDVTYTFSESVLESAPSGEDA